MLSFMIATGFLSMWTSNNSTTLMMLPIGLAIIAREKELGADTKRFAPALMLAIAYSASIGGQVLYRDSTKFGFCKYSSRAP